MSKTFRLELDKTDIAFINDAAVQLPYYRAAPFIHKINQQIQESIAQDTAVELQKANSEAQPAVDFSPPNAQAEAVPVNDPLPSAPFTD